MMDTEIAIAMLKVLGALIGGMLGAAGLLANFRDASGNLTRWGMAVLSGIAISAAVGVVTSTFEARKDLVSSREQAARTETVLRELSRSIQPIGELKLTYWMEIPQGTKIVDAYVTRLNAGIEKRIALLKKIATPNDAIKGLHAWAIDVDGEPLNVEIEPESDLWPRDDEAAIGNIAKFFVLSVDIFKTPVHPDEYQPIHGRSDFGVDFGLPGSSVLQWDRKKKQLVLYVKIEFDKTLWATNGRLTSIVDLYGAQILLFPPNSRDLPGNLRAFQNEMLTEFSNSMNQKAIPVEQQMELSRSMNLKTISFEFGEGRSFWVQGKHFKKSTYKGGYPVFSVTLPKDESEFREFTTPREDE